jgi:hypothetical protein
MYFERPGYIEALCAKTSKAWEALFLSEANKNLTKDTN